MLPLSEVRKCQIVAGLDHQQRNAGSVNPVPASQPIRRTSYFVPRALHGARRPWLAAGRMARMNPYNCSWYADVQSQ
jgi:hypothetical protein